MCKRNYQKLRGRIVERFETCDKFADYIGTSRQTVSGKLNSKVEFSQSDISLWCEALGIDPVDIPFYFFTKEVAKSEL